VLKRVAIAQVGLVLLGIASFFFVGKRQHLIGFATGALVASASLWVLTRLTAAVTGQKQNPLSFLLITTRLLIAGWLLYAILQRYEVDRVALALGVATPVLAILVIALYDAIHASRARSSSS
jgi:type VI protein secretion system component VasK